MSIRRGDLIWIEPPLASGGMAEVWRVINRGVEGVNNISIVKRILHSYSSNIEFQKMIVDEARITSQLHKPIANPNIIQIQEFQQYEDEYLLFLEYVNGPDVRKIISACDKKKVEFPISFCLYIISEVLSGLYHAHNITDVEGKSLGVIHRDISPQNVLVSYNGDVKIIDWGIADYKMKSTETVVGIIKGKYGYMSPEQANAEKLDFKTDLYSAGVVLWEMLTRRRLFIHENDLKVLRKIQKAEIENPRKFNKDVSKDLSNIVLKALARKKEKRYADCLEFAQAVTRERNKIDPEFNKMQVGKFLHSLFEEEIRKDQLIISQAEKQAPSHSPPTPKAPSVAKRKIKIQPREKSNLVQSLEVDISKIQDSGLKIEEVTGSFTPTPYKGIKRAESRSESKVLASFLKMTPYLLFFLIVALVGIVLYIRSLDRYPPVIVGSVHPTIIPATGRNLEIRSDLKGLHISVVGLKYTKEDVGPFLIEDLPPQSAYLVEISKIGYETITDTIQIANNTKYIMEINHLIPVGATGSLFLDTSPNGAYIYVDDIKLGYITPNTISNLPIGKEVKITLKRHGYIDYSFRITMRDEDELVKRSITLESAKGQLNGKIPSLITLDSTPQGAFVYIDSDYVCKTPCAYKKGYVNDVLNIDMKLQGYKRYFTAFPLNDSTNYLNPILEKVAGFGYLTLKTQPAGGDVYINGKPIGRKTPLTYYKVNSGVNTIKVVSKKDNKEKYSVNVINIPPGAHVIKNIRIK